MGFELKNRTLTIDLSDPTTLNAFSTKMVEELELVLGDFYKENRESIHAVLLRSKTIRSKDKKFALTGGDLKTLNKFKDDQAAFTGYFDKMNAVCSKISEIDVPVICCVDGYVAGGGIEFMSSADIRYCTTHSSFHFKQLQNGVFTGFGGCLRLSQLVGLGVTQKWLLLSSHLTAEQAQESALIHDTFADTTAMQRSSNAICSQFAKYSREQLVTQKEMLLLIKKPYKNAELQEHRLTMENVHNRAFLKFLGSFNEKS